MYGEKDSDWYFIADANMGNWIVYPANSFYIFNDTFKVLRNSYFVSSQMNEAGELENLYSWFTYDKGAYKAKLYLLPYEDGTVPEYQVEIKFNKDGYVSYFSQTEVQVENSEYVNASYTVKTSISFSNFGTTTATIDKDAKKAIDDYKAANPVQAH